jgi:hypothetical protein
LTAAKRKLQPSEERQAIYEAVPNVVDGRFPIECGGLPVAQLLPQPITQQPKVAAGRQSQTLVDEAEGQEVIDRMIGTTVNMLDTYLPALLSVICAVVGGDRLK